MVFVGKCYVVFGEEQNLSTQLLQVQNKHLLKIQQHSLFYYRVLLVFELKNTKCVINPIKSHLSETGVNEYHFEPSVISKANQSCL